MKLTRRDFLKKAGLGAAGITAMGLLASCGAKDDSTSNKDDAGNTDATGNNDKPEQIEQTTGKVEGTVATTMVNSISIALTGSSFDVAPFGGASGARDWFCNNMYGTLMCADKFGATYDELKPWLAKSVTKVDDVTYDIELWDNITDNQGNKITADDVIWSYDTMASEGEITIIGTDMKSLEKKDDTHLTMTLNAAGNGSIEGLLSMYRENILSRSWYEGASDDDRNNNPAVTGAYYIKKYTPGSELVLEAVENYWMPEADRPGTAVQNVKTIRYPVIAEAAMRSIALENGEIDVTQVTASELQRFYADGKPIGDWNVLINGGNMFTGVWCNMDSGMSPLADDVNLRKAVLYAINSEDIIYAGGGDLSTNMLCKSQGTSAMAGFQPEWEDEDYFDYNPEKAKEFLAASDHPDGVTLRLLSRTTTGDAVHAVYINNLEEIGIKVELLAYDQALFNQYKFDSTQWDLIIDTKGANGHITQGWNDMYNPDGYSNGGAFFTHDDHLTELLADCYQHDDDAATKAFHDYMKEIAVGKGITAGLKLTVGQKGILELTPSNCFNPRVNAYVFAEDYVSVAE